MAAAPPIFAVLASGQLVQTNFQRLTETDFVVDIPNANKLNHIAIFLSGAEPFPDGFAGSIYFRITGPDPNWHYLGMISNDKPSAFFRVSGLKEGGNHNKFFEAQSSIAEVGCAQVGITVEPYGDAIGRSPPTNTAVSSTSSFSEFQEKAIRNLLNFVESFAKYMPNPDNPARREYFVPVNKITQWYDNFKHRLTIDPNFWKTLSTD
uniref:DUF775 domain-containing protein n=1 Tax=Panagrellus redivivus TaxID=6233 RepID=A0A7E4UYF0_PANRE